MVVLICLLLWLIPILIFGIYAWYKMKSGESLQDFIHREDREVEFIFSIIPGFNLLIPVKLVLELGINYLLNLKKP